MLIVYACSIGLGDLGVIGVQPDFALGNDIGRNKLTLGMELTLSTMGKYIIT